MLQSGAMAEMRGRSGPIRWRSLLFGGGLLLAACRAQDVRVEQPLPTVAAAATSLVSAVPSVDEHDTGWRTIEAGLEFRRMPLVVDQRRADFSILRLDPKAYRIRVAYDSAQPGRISDWAAAVKPIALINGGYFDAKKKATALVIFDGISVGASYEGFGGMVVVNAAGEFELRSLRQQPYNPSEQLQQAMQSSPMLIQPGGVVPDLDVDDKRSRRTVIARDTGGHILLMVSDFPVLTLKELAILLKQSDLDLDAALNLDGGRSTGMYVNAGSMHLTIDSFDTLPLVLVVDKKS